MATQNRLLKTKIRLLNGTQGDWEQLSTYQLAQGEPAIEFVPSMPTEANPDATLTSVKVKIGDGFTMYKDLPYVGDEIRDEMHSEMEQLKDTLDGLGNEVYQITATDLEGVTGNTEGDKIKNFLSSRGSTPKKGNIAIVTRDIVNSTNGHTAYVYDGANWAAMDGNYNAENVYFNEDLTITADIGAQKLNGKNSMTLNAKGKSLEEVLKSILAQTLDPEATSPTLKLEILSITTDTGTDEVGSKIKSVKYKATFTDGKYTYGSKDGDTVYTAEDGAGLVPTYNIGCTVDGSSKSASTATFDLAVGSRPVINTTTAKSYGKITASASWSESNRAPVNNLGETPSTNVKIASGSLDDAKDISKTGYRSWFVYAGTDKTSVVNSNFIRTNATNKGKFGNGGTVDVTVPFGTKRVLVALPSSISYDLTGVKDLVSNYSAFGPFVKSTVTVEGINGFTGETYNVWVSENDGFDATTYQLSFTKKQG